MAARTVAMEPEVDEFEDLEDMEETDEDLDELEEVEEEEAPTKPTKTRATKAKATKAKAVAKTEPPKFGSTELAAHINEVTGEKYDARAARMLLRKLARDGNLDRQVGESRDRYSFSGPDDPTVKAVVAMVKDGTAKALKQAGLDRVKERAEARRAAKKAADEAAAEEVEEVEDEVEEEVEEEEAPKPAPRRRPAAAKTAAKAAPAKAAPSTRRRSATPKQ